MHDQRALIACGWREQSIPCPYPFRLESKLWNRKQPPWQLVVALCAALPKTRQCLQTSSRDRFARATLDFRSASSLRLGHGHQYQSPWRTIESPALARFETDCIQSGTSGNGRPSQAPDARIRTEYHAREQPFARFEIFLGPPDERFSPENLAQSHRRQQGPYSRE